MFPAIFASMEKTFAGVALGSRRLRTVGEVVSEDVA
jgi:hypothetical protein